MSCRPSKKMNNGNICSSAAVVSECNGSAHQNTIYFEDNNANQINNFNINNATILQTNSYFQTAFPISHSLGENITHLSQPLQMTYFPQNIVLDTQSITFSGPEGTYASPSVAFSSSNPVICSPPPQLEQASSHVVIPSIFHNECKTQDLSTDYLLLPGANHQNKVTATKQKVELLNKQHDTVSSLSIPQHNVKLVNPQCINDKKGASNCLESKSPTCDETKLQLPHVKIDQKPVPPLVRQCNKRKPKKKKTNKRMMKIQVKSDRENAENTTDGYSSGEKMFYAPNTELLESFYGNEFNVHLKESLESYNIRLCPSLDSQVVLEGSRQNLTDFRDKLLQGNPKFSNAKEKNEIKEKGNKEHIIIPISFGDSLTAVKSEDSCTDDRDDPYETISGAKNGQNSYHSNNLDTADVEGESTDSVSDSVIQKETAKLKKLAKTKKKPVTSEPEVGVSDNSILDEQHDHKTNGKRKPRKKSVAKSNSSISKECIKRDGNDSNKDQNENQVQSPKQTRYQTRRKEKRSYNLDISFSDDDVVPDIEIKEKIKKKKEDIDEFDPGDITEETEEEVDISEEERESKRGYTNKKCYKCTMCEYTTFLKCQWTKHLRYEHQILSKPVSKLCPHCGFQASSQQDIDDHMYMRHNTETENPQPRYVCDQCAKTYEFKKRLLLHISHYHKERTFQCSQCEMCFDSFTKMSTHKRRFHRNLSRTHDCTFCGKKFAYKNKMKYHINAVHLKQKNLQCPWASCEKTFCQRWSLKVHYRTHTDEKPLKCEVCDYSCRQKNALDWHMKSKHPDFIKPIYNELPQLQIATGNILSS